MAAHIPLIRMKYACPTEWDLVAEDHQLEGKLNQTSPPFGDW
jgi:hypothetical protein